MTKLQQDIEALPPVELIGTLFRLTANNSSRDVWRSADQRKAEYCIRALLRKAGAAVTQEAVAQAFDCETANLLTK